MYLTILNNHKNVHINLVLNEYFKLLIFYNKDKHNNLLNIQIDFKDNDIYQYINNDT